jgi:hypothetical protein
MNVDREEIMARVEDGQKEMRTQDGSLASGIDTIQEKKNAMNIHQENEPAVHSNRPEFEGTIK